VEHVARRETKVNKQKVETKTLPSRINPLKAELNPICHLLALLGAHHILHVSRIRVKRRLDGDNITGLK
jgi:hypothetical protein